jgi:hypothetical protein
MEIECDDRVKNGVLRGCPKNVRKNCPIVAGRRDEEIGAWFAEFGQAIAEI